MITDLFMCIFTFCTLLFNWSINDRKFWFNLPYYIDDNYYLEIQYFDSSDKTVIATNYNPVSFTTACLAAQRTVEAPPSAPPAPPARSLRRSPRRLQRPERTDAPAHLVDQHDIKRWAQVLW